MSYYVKPWSDIFIRFLLGSESNTDLLLSFVSDVFEDAGFEPITHVKIRNPFNVQNAQEGKTSILDVKATDCHGRIIEIEVQASSEPSYRARTLYYWAKLYSDQLKEGDHYRQLRPVVCINLLNFNLLQETERFHNCFMLLEKEQSGDRSQQTPDDPLFGVVQV